MAFQDFGETRQSNRREAVRRISKDIPEDDAMIAESRKHGIVFRSSETHSVHQYENESVMAGGFHKVRVFVTNKLDGGVRKWSDTGIIGMLRVMLLDRIAGMPIACIRVNKVGSDGLMRRPVFEYELPLNFNFDKKLSSTFCAVQTHLKGEYFGFLFSNSDDKR